MGLWSWYFLVKGYLYFRGLIAFDPLFNLLFVVWLLVPLPQAVTRSWVIMAARALLNTVVALLLLWHDSWLPPLFDTVGFLRDAGLPSKEFIYRLLADAINPWDVGAAVVILGACWVIQRHVRLTFLVLLLLCVVAVREYGQPREHLDRVVASFYADESKRIVHIVPPTSSPPDFDVVIIHVCSLSWDDLAAIGKDQDEFFQTFDYLFTNFNSVTGHSNPAAIRLLRSGCGQTPHDALYRPANDECYLFDALRHAGFHTMAARNHDGKYGSFDEETQRLGHAGQAIPLDDLPVPQYDFTGAPIYDDYAVLQKWWAMRRRMGPSPEALYYNTITLHDGGHWANETEWWKRDRTVQYREFVDKLFSDLTRFFTLLASSDRPSLVVFVPEHGMALRGSKFQPAGIREVPLPQITTVPVGVKLIEPRRPGRGSHPHLITHPTSYFGLTSLMATIIAQSSAQIDDAMVSRLAEAVPRTEFLSENQAARVVRDGTDYYLKARSVGGRWVKLNSNLFTP